MAKKPTTGKRRAKKGTVGRIRRTLSFDVVIRTDKLRVWLENHPGETPPGLTSEEVTELLGE